MSKEVDFNFLIDIITCNMSISQLLISKSSELNLKYISKFTLNNIGILNSKYSKSHGKILWWELFLPNLGGLRLE